MRTINLIKTTFTQLSHFNYIDLMIQAIVPIENNRYPFDQQTVPGQILFIQDTQEFCSKHELLQKKTEMLAKSKIIDCPYLIKLLKVYQEDFSLHYLYEHVPYSLSTLIRKNYKKGSPEIVEMSSKLFLKKMNYELAVLISYLINMKIEIDLSVENIGFSQDEKMKVFMNSKCKMGNKNQLSLISLYNQRKQKILAFLERELSNYLKKQEPRELFCNNSNKLAFADIELNQSMLPQTLVHTQSQPNSILNDSNLFQSSYNQSTASCIDPIKAKAKMNIRNTSYNLGDTFKKRERRESVFSMDGGSKSRSNNFHFGANNKRKQSCADYGGLDQDNSDAKSYTHSKSIRIQLSQNKDGNKRKDRKDSYKIKVTTFHEYEMDDCDPTELLGSKMPKNQEDIAQFFSRQSPSKSEKYNKMDKNAGFNLEEKISPSANSSFFYKQNRQSTATTARTLQEKVRAAKQRAELLLKRYPNSKRISPFEESSAYLKRQ